MDTIKCIKYTLVCLPQNTIKMYVKQKWRLLWHPPPTSSFPVLADLGLGPSSSSSCSRAHFSPFVLTGKTPHLLNTNSPSTWFVHRDPWMYVAKISWYHIFNSQATIQEGAPAIYHVSLIYPFSSLALSDLFLPLNPSAVFYVIVLITLGKLSDSVNVFIPETHCLTQRI